MTLNHKFTSHILEFRKKLTFCLVSYCLFLVPLIYFDRQLFDIFCVAINHLPQAQLIATEVAAPFMVPIKLALYLSLYVSAPIFFYQLWHFIAPGLYHEEKKPVFILSTLSISLFYIGAFFAYALVCPIALKFFVTMAPSNVHVMTDIGLYTSFILKMMVMFGLAFQVPIIVCVLMMTKIQSAQSLKQKRSYVIVASFIIGMLLTPPDVVSQILMAIPMIGLFELGILLGSVLKTKNPTTTQSEV